MMMINSNDLKVEQTHQDRVNSLNRSFNIEDKLQRLTWAPLEYERNIVQNLPWPEVSL